MCVYRTAVPYRHYGTAVRTRGRNIYNKAAVRRPPFMVLHDEQHRAQFETESGSRLSAFLARLDTISKCGRRPPPAI